MTVKSIRKNKIYTSVLTRRVTFHTSIYNKINESKAGFREGYGTNAYILYCLIHKYLSEKDGKLYVGYVDLTKTCDLVNRDKLWKAVGEIKQFSSTNSQKKSKEVV